MKIKTYLPLFPGFYGTIFEPDEDNAMEYIYDLRQENGLTELDYNQFEFDYQEYENEVGQNCCNFLENELKDFVKSIKFEHISSPKEYNFYNDAIYCIIEPKKNSIWDFIKAYIVEFEKYIKDRYTSRSGFISHYSNNYKDWLNRDSLNDSHKLGSILDFICHELEIDETDMFEYCNTYLTVSNFEECTEMEYCSECLEWVKPENFNGNCCNDCNDFHVQNLDKIVCTHCKEVITNNWEQRQLKHKLNHSLLKPNEVLCSDCLPILI